VCAASAFLTRLVTDASSSFSWSIATANRFGSALPFTRLRAARPEAVDLLRWLGANPDVIAVRSPSSRCRRERLTEPNVLGTRSPIAGIGAFGFGCTFPFRISATLSESSAFSIRTRLRFCAELIGRLDAARCEDESADSPSTPGASGTTTVKATSPFGVMCTTLPRGCAAVEAERAEVDEEADADDVDEEDAAEEPDKDEEAEVSLGLYGALLIDGGMNAYGRRPTGDVYSACCESSFHLGMICGLILSTVLM